MDRSKKKNRFFWLILLAAILPAGAPVFAQRAKLFQFGRWGGSFKFRFYAKNRQALELRKDRIFYEDFILRNSGFIIHPKLFSFRLTGDVRFFQEKIVGTNYLMNLKGHLAGLNLTTSILSDSKTPIMLMFNKSTNDVNMNFDGYNRYKLTNIQGTLDLPAFFIPSRLHAEHQDIREFWSRGGFAVYRDQIRQTASISGRRNDAKSLIDVDYDYYGTLNRLYPQRSYNIHNARFRYRYKINVEETSIFESDVYVNLNTGITNYKSAKMEQRLELQHSPWLHSKLRYSIAFRRSLDATTLQSSLFGSLGHDLYKSLKTTIGVGGSYSKSNFGHLTNRMVNASIAYNKNIPFGGRLQISYSRNLGLTDRQVESTVQEIANERHLVYGSVPIMLNERNIILSSVEVLDEENGIIFEQGEARDYILRSIGDYVEIVVSPLGRIRENSAILVNYRFQTLPTLKFLMDTEVFNASLSFSAITFYHIINNHLAKLLDGTVAARALLGDLHVTTTGLRISSRGKLFGISLRGECRTQESPFLAYEIIDFRNTLLFRPVWNLGLSTTLLYSQLTHALENAKIRSRAIRGELRWRPTIDLSLFGFVRYSYREQSLYPKEGIYEYGGTLERFWRVLRLKLRYEDRTWEYGLRLINDRRFLVEVERIF